MAYTRTDTSLTVSHMSRLLSDSDDLDEYHMIHGSANTVVRVTSRFLAKTSEMIITGPTFLHRPA
jgi:hypothetical protein